MLLTLISGFWILIQSFMNGGANHMLLTLKMLCGVAALSFSNRHFHQSNYCYTTQHFQCKQHMICPAIHKLKMLCGVAVVGLMEVSIAKRKRHEQSHTMFWITIAFSM
jgi:hypothetical protein